MTHLEKTELKRLGWVMAAAVVVAGCRSKDSSQVGNSREAASPATQTADSAQSGDSPEAAHRAMCAAIQTENWRKLADCLTPESRDFVASELFMSAHFAAMKNKRDRRAVRDLIERHGIIEPDDESEAPQVTAPLSTDVKLWYQRPDSMRRGTDPGAPRAEPPLFATLVVDGKPAAQATRIGFLRVDAVRDD